MVKKMTSNKDIIPIIPINPVNPDDVLPGQTISNLPAGGALQAGDLIGAARQISPGVYTNVKLNGNVTGAITSVMGTSEQVLVNGTSGIAQTGILTLSGPQNLATISSPTFLSLTLSELSVSRLVATNGSKVLTSVPDLTAWVIGTSNRITSTSNGSGGTTIDIANTYVGQTSITTLGTLTTGTWSATTIAVSKGGTGQTEYSDGQILIGNTVTGGLNKATLTAGTGISITNGNGTITISSSGGAGDVTGIIGTANQILANGTSGSSQDGEVTLSLPSDNLILSSDLTVAGEAVFGAASVGSANYLFSIDGDDITFRLESTSANGKVLFSLFNPDDEWQIFMDGAEENLNIWNDDNRISIDPAGNTDIITGDLSILGAGKTLLISNAANGCYGTGTLSGGTATINTTAVRTGDLVIPFALTGANAGSLSYTIIDLTSFTVTSTNVLDARDFTWAIIKPTT